MSVLSRVRSLNTRYKNQLKSLEKDYKQALKELQDQCSHDNETRWEYRIDSYGKVASTSEGVLIKYSECLECGYVKEKVDNKLDYDSEILF